MICTPSKLGNSVKTLVDSVKVGETENIYITRTREHPSRV